MSNFYIADLHLFHAATLKDGHFHERPFTTLDEMHHAIISRWNEVVTNGDTVYVLGDVSYSAHSMAVSEVISALKGHLVLIKGNHDKPGDARIKRQFDEIVDYKEIVDNVGGVQHKVVLCHYPLFSWKDMFRGAIHLYGHVHDNPDDVLYQEAIAKSDRYFAQRDGDRHKPFIAINVGCMREYMNYQPKTLAQLLAERSAAA